MPTPLREPPPKTQSITIEHKTKTCTPRSLSLHFAGSIAKQEVPGHFPTRREENSMQTINSNLMERSTITFTGTKGFGAVTGGRHEEAAGHRPLSQRTPVARPEHNATKESQSQGTRCVFKSQSAKSQVLLRASQKNQQNIATKSLSVEAHKESQRFVRAPAFSRFQNRSVFGILRSRGS